MTLSTIESLIEDLHYELMHVDDEELLFELEQLEEAAQEDGADLEAIYHALNALYEQY